MTSTPHDDEKPEIAPPRIAIFDSGIGGTSVLDAVRERAPWADIVYVADHAYGPYGERTLDQVRDRTEILARYLGTVGIDVIVIACNSASAAALHHLRSALPEVTFVGMEPAVKPASATTSSGVIAVMATHATFQGELFRSLVWEHGRDVEIIEQECPGLASIIERGDDPGPLLDEFLAPIRHAHADVVVLGCTHYPLVRDEIAQRLGEGVEIVDPSPAVALRVIDMAQDMGVDLQGNASTRWWTTAVREIPRDRHPWEIIDIPAETVAAIRVRETTICAVLGDVTTMSVDAIVNAANVGLTHGGGIALAISRVGGPVIDDESRSWIDTYGPIESGVAALTSAGDMPSSYVIHVAGPIYSPGEDNEALLGATTYAALDMADEIDIDTVALPAISAGIYGYPPDDATSVIAQSAAEYLSDGPTALSGVRLVGHDLAMANRFSVAIDALSLTNGELP